MPGQLFDIQLVTQNGYWRPKCVRRSTALRRAQIKTMEQEEARRLPAAFLIWYSKSNAPVAQLDRASGYEPEGRVFESLRAHHFSLPLIDFPSLADTNKRLSFYKTSPGNAQ